jgi:site-specific recombinase XerD
MELRGVLPPNTFPVLAALVGWREHVEKPEPTWTELSASFEYEMGQRMALGKLQPSTAERYRQTIDEFALFPSQRNVSHLKDITRPVIEAFKVWRVSRIRKKKFSRGATSIALDAAIIHRVFSFASENEMVLKNPVRMEGNPELNGRAARSHLTAGK